MPIVAMPSFAKPARLCGTVMTPLIMRIVSASIIVTSGVIESSLMRMARIIMTTHSVIHADVAL